MKNSVENLISTKELFKQFEWYKNTFSGAIQQTCDDFFTKNFQTEFIGLSKNINSILNNEASFVTKIKIEKDYDMFFRVSKNAAEVILDKILGKSQKRFNLNNITELETKIITSFNAYLYNTCKDIINPPDPKELDRSNFDMVNLTFIIKDIDSDSVYKLAGKIVISLPEILLSPESITSTGEKFSKDDFSLSVIDVKIKVGKTSFKLIDIKNLEAGDLVVFENSNIRELTLNLFGQDMTVNLNPNMNIYIAEEINKEGDNNMAESHNLWDNIEVDMFAEFDSVKITLGELKNIEQGLVVDLASLYNNKVTLRVEGKDIATGSLVIVNDRYGVKIDEIIANNENSSASETQEDQEVIENEEFEEENNEVQEESEQYLSEDEELEQNEAQNPQDEEEFDYSDFELEDENI